MNRYYKAIITTSDMYNLYQEAAKENKNAVGISSNGTLFKFDDSQKKPVPITETEAAKLLDVTNEDIRNIVAAKGDYIIPDVEVSIDALHEADLEVLPGEVVEELEEVTLCDCDFLKRENDKLINEVGDLTGSNIELQDKLEHEKEENQKLRADLDALKNELSEVKEANNKLLFENVELEVKAKKEPPITLESAIKFVKDNGYELKIK